MKKKHNSHVPKRGTIQKLTYKYKLSIINENTLEETFSSRISRLSLIAWVGLFFLVTFAILATLILFTPVKYMLPGYADRTLKERVVTDYMRIDSLSAHVEKNDRQLLILKNIIAGNIQIDSMNETTDSLSLEELKHLPLGAARTEQHFVSAYEDDNLYNVNNFTNRDNNPEAILFASPVHGSIQKRFSPTDNDGITILTKAGAPIVAAQKGRIIHAYELQDMGYSVIIAHENGYITIYHNIGQLIHHKGDDVDSGEAIGFLTTDNGTENSFLQFELWHNGIQTNPEEYIIF